MGPNVHHFFAINKTAPRAATSTRIVPVLKPPMPEDESRELAAVLLDGVIIVVPLAVLYVVVGAMTRLAIVVHEFSSVFSSF
jgi:hypothetical protein